MVAVLAVVVLTLAFMKLLGGLRFSDGVTQALVRTADALGVHGDEGIENLYMLGTVIVGLVLSILIVGGLHAIGWRRLAR